MKWQITKDVQPLHDQAVISWSSRVGMWRGFYDREFHSFYGKGGYLDGEDVECWMEDEKQNMPTHDTIPEELSDVYKEWLSRHKS